MNDQPYIIRPLIPLPGALAQVVPINQLGFIHEVETRKLRHTYVVRAIIGENIPLGLDIPQILALSSNSLMSINGDTQTIYLHHSGLNAVFFDIVPKVNGELAHIEVQVEADHPDGAIAPARTAINKLLDTLMREIWLPLTIIRLDVFHESVEGPIMYEIHFPFLRKLSFGPMGGYDSFPLLAEYESMAREAILATSPYYRFLCAFRLCEAVRHFRSEIRKYVEKFNVTEKMPKAPFVDQSLVLNFGFTAEFAEKVTRFDDLISQFMEFRNAISHTLTKEYGDRPVHLSDGNTYRLYAAASALLLFYSHSAFEDLRIYFNMNISSRLFRGSILPEIERREHFKVKAPKFWSAEEK